MDLTVFLLTQLRKRPGIPRYQNLNKQDRKFTRGFAYEVYASRTDWGRGYNSAGAGAAAPPLNLAKINNDVVHMLNKRTIDFEKNIAEIDSLQFDFVSKEEGTATFYKEGNFRSKYPFVLSTRNYALGFDSTLQLPVALQANFKNENEFILHFNQLCRINNFYFHFVIDENKVTTTMEETSKSIKTNIETSFK